MKKRVEQLSQGMRKLLRVLLSYYVLNGLVVALCLFAVTSVVGLFQGSVAGSVAGLAVVVCAPPDHALPVRGKTRGMLPAPILSIPLFFALQMLHDNPVHMAMLLIPATFFIFLGMAWGKRGIPIAVSLMFAMIFSMAAQPLPDSDGSIWRSAMVMTGYFALGCLLYMVFTVQLNRWLNNRYRVQYLANALLDMAALMRAQAVQFETRSQIATLGERSAYTPELPDVEERTETAGQEGTEQGQSHGRAPKVQKDKLAISLTATLLRRHAVLADTLQNTRDMVLARPDTPQRQRLANMMLELLELRDHLLACDLEMDALKVWPVQAPLLMQMQMIFVALAQEMEDLADNMLLARRPAAPHNQHDDLIHLPWGDAAAQALSAQDRKLHDIMSAIVHGLAQRVDLINTEIMDLYALARKEQEPDLASIRNNWQLFISPVNWSFKPFFSLWHWDAPPMRHALRALLAVSAGYGISVLIPWNTHAHWILLTIVVVLRGSLSQTLERRNSRVMGTMLGCVLTVGLLSLHLPFWTLLLLATVSQGVSHGFAIQRYLICSVGGTVVGLVQTHMMGADNGANFLIAERLMDTVIGAGVAWIFSYVLPSWERGRITLLMRRTLRAQANNARLSLGTGQLEAPDDSHELAWRLARREVYDSLSALAQATQRSLSEPRAVRAPVHMLERLQVHSYQLLTQMTSIKTMLMQYRAQCSAVALKEPLEQADGRIHALLTQRDIPQSELTSQAQKITAMDIPVSTQGEPIWSLHRRVDAAMAVAARIRLETVAIGKELARRTATKAQQNKKPVTQAQK